MTSCRACDRHTARSMMPASGLSPSVAATTHSSNGALLSSHSAGPSEGMSNDHREPRTSLARSMSCRATTASRISPRESPVSAAGVLTTTDCTNPSIASVVSPSHCTIGRPATGPVGTSSWSAAEALSRDATAASARGVRLRKIWVAVTKMPSARNADSSEIARMLSPPSSKKSWSAPTRSTRSTDATAAQIAASPSLAAAATGPVSATGSGSARRSSFPLGVNGNSGITTMCAGTMYSTRCSPAHCFTASAVRPSAAGTT